MRAPAGAASPSLLDYALLGLLHERPRSGYDLRKCFVATPMRLFRDSPGTVYPALRRLQARGWARVAPSAASRRGRRLFAPTVAGRRVLRAWLRRPVTRDDVVWRSQGLMLRFSFLDAMLPARDVAAFLESLAREVDDYVKVLGRYHSAAAAAMPLSGRLALEAGIGSYRGLARWARRAAGLFRKEG